MLEQFSAQVRECHERAAEAKAKAEATTDPALQDQFLNIERCWLTLANGQASVAPRNDVTATNGHGAGCGARQGASVGVNGNGGAADAQHLQQIATSFVPEGNLDVLYERILDAAIGLMSSDMASLQVFHPERSELRLLAWRGFRPQSAAFWQWVRLDSRTSCGLASAAGSRVVVPDIETWDFVAGTPDLDEFRRCGIRAMQSTPLVSRSGELLGMISTHWRAPHHPAEFALRQLDVLGRQAADLIERGKVEAALRENEERMRWLASIVESSDDAIVSKNLDGIILSWNQGAERVFGYTATETIGQPVTMLIPPERHEEEPVILDRLRRGERIDHYETIRRRKDGGLIVVSLTVSPVKNADGKVVGASKIARDITEQKRAGEQIATLAREAEHRTKNVLATVLATVNLSHADTVEGLKTSIQGRIQALADVHTLFVQSRWEGAEMTMLAAQELAPYLQGDEARARIDGPQLLLEPNAAQTIAMTLHELATNAAKYGALSNAKGCVEVTWSLAADGRLVLRWIESGGPPVAPPTHRGFGTRVIERLISGQLKGDMLFDWRAEGLACEITFRM